MRGPFPATRLQGFGTSIFAEMTRLAQEHGAVNLAQGFPDFPGPAFVKEAAIDAIRADRNQYARSSGELPLVRAIAADLQRRTGLEHDPVSEVVVFSGATEALHCAMMGLCEPGDEVVVLEPYYDSYPAGVAMAGGVLRPVTLRWPDLRWDPAALAAAFGPRTKLLLLNTPHNPSGRVLSRPEMEELAALCVKHDVTCVTDEVYDQLVYEGEHIPMATLPGMRERTVSIYSTGKTFSMTGWKIGYAAGPKALVGSLAAAHQFVTFATSTPFQHAMVAALGAPASYYTEFLAEYRERREFLLHALTRCGFAVQAPQGSYFILADGRPLGQPDGPAFCRDLVENAKVAVVPAVAFYTNRAEGLPLLRFAFCKSMETLVEGARRLERAL
jgi:N-succinyldiaminopimelate aminotransferase